MADKKIKVKVDVETNAEGSIAQLKELKKQLKQTAAGSEEFKKLYNQIDDLEDKIKSSKNVSADWIDTLESAGGPIGALGAGLNKLKVSTQSFGAALKATGIGLVVAAVGGLVAAFSNVEGATKKLEPLMIGLERILGGIFEALTPLIDSFVELASSALPYITTGVKVFYSSLVSLFTLVKEGGAGVGKILKGIFTLDTKEIEAGFNQLKGSWNKTVETYNATSERFEAGTKKLTKTEKENLKERNEALKKAAEEAKRIREEEKKTLMEGQEEAMKTLLTEQEKEIYETQKKYANLLYLATKYGEDTTQLTEAQAKEVAAINKKYADEAKEKADKDAKEKADKDKEEADKLKEKKQKELDDRILGLESQLQFDVLSFQQRRDTLSKLEAEELTAADLTDNQKTAIKKKYAAERKAIDDAELEYRYEIQTAQLDLVAKFGSFLSEIAGENKELAIAGIVVQQAAAIGQIIASTSIANAKAVAANPLGFGQPWVTINTISAGLSIATTIASAAKQIAQIKAQPGKNAGGGGAVGGGGAAIALPKVSGAAAPQVNIEGGANPTAQIGETISKAQKPIRAYVISGEVSSQQALDRRTNRAATFSGG